MMAYFDNYLINTSSRVILGVEAMRAAAKESDRVDRTRFVTTL